jgi:hypothetical protein
MGPHGGAAGPPPGLSGPAAAADPGGPGQGSWGPPGGPPPPPPRRSGPSPLAWALIAVGAVTVILVVVVAVFLIVPHGSFSRTPESADQGKFGKVPDACATLADADVAKVLTGAGKYPAGSTGGTSICRWESPGSNNRSPSTLEVDLTRFAGTDGTTAESAAHQRFAQMARPAPPNEGFTGIQQTIPGLGDEATLTGSPNQITDGKPVYDYVLWIRMANVTAKVTYIPRVYGADGSLDDFAGQTRSRSGELDMGTHIAYNIATSSP